MCYLFSKICAKLYAGVLALYEKYRFRGPGFQKHPNPPPSSPKVSLSVVFKDGSVVQYTKQFPPDDSLEGEDFENAIHKMVEYKEYLQDAEIASLSKSGGDWELDVVMTRDGHRVRRKDVNNGN